MHHCLSGRWPGARLVAVKTRSESNCTHFLVCLATLHYPLAARQTEFLTVINSGYVWWLSHKTRKSMTALPSPFLGIRQNGPKTSQALRQGTWIGNPSVSCLLFTDTFLDSGHFDNIFIRRQQHMIYFPVHFFKATLRSFKLKAILDWFEQSEC